MIGVVHAEVIDASGHKRLGVRVQVAVAEWTGGVCDHAADGGEFIPEAAVAQIVVVWFIG